MGDGVNIAARLESITKPGAICLSEQAYWQVKSRLDLAVSDLGATQLKILPSRSGSIRSKSVDQRRQSRHWLQHRLASPLSFCPLPISAATQSRSISSMA
jgi:hypothetical protein